MISEADNRRIVEAIRAAEAKTSGKSTASSRAPAASTTWCRSRGRHWSRFAVPWSLIHFTKWPAGIIYLVQLAAFIAAALALSLPMIRFRIVPKRRLHGRAHVVAMQQFLAQGIHLTEKRTGVLIFASVAERYAEIVADSGINAKVTPDAWAGAVAAMVSAIKAGRPGDGFVAAIELCGAQLARNFPPGELNPNELPDRVVEI